jgi:uncharacterized protein
MSSSPSPAHDPAPGSVLPPELLARYQDPDVIARLLAETRTIAVVGLSPDPARDSWQVAHYLQAAGYRIIPVNPKAIEILDETAYPSLADVPVPVDLVDVFRRPADCVGVAEQAVAAGAKAIWFQLGVISPDAAALAERAGLAVVMDRCLLVEHAARRS